MSKDKLVLPFAILLASIIFGGFYYAAQVNKQQSIERQQKIKMEQERLEGIVKRAQEEVEREREKVDDMVKTAHKRAQEKVEYIAKRRMDCYKIYEKEKATRSNVIGCYYNVAKDVCIIEYEDINWKEGDPLFGESVDMDGDGHKETYKAGKFFEEEF